MTAFQAVASGNWNTGAVWGNSGNVEGTDWPSTGDTAEIDSANKTGGQGALDVALVADVTITAFKLYSNSSSHVVTISAAAERTITCTGSDFSGYCWLISAWTDFDGTINLKSTKSSGTVHHNTHSSGGWPTDKPHDVTLDGGMNLYSVTNLDISGNLTITNGTYNTQHISGGTSYSVTVAGTTTIGDGSASADTSTLTCNASAVSLGSEVTGTHSLVVDTGGTFVGGSGTHTLGSLNIKNSTAAKCTLTSGVTTIDGEGSANKAINIEGANGVTNFAHGSGTVIITHDGASDIKADGVTLALNNLTINHASADIKLKGILSVAGNLTITAGKLDTDSSNDFALTVGTNTDDGGATGHLLILDEGELVCNSSTVIVGSVYCQIAAGSNGTGFSELNLPDSSGSFTVRGPEKNNYIFRLDNQAEVNHNGGTVTFAITAESGSTIMDTTTSRGTGVNNILVTQSESGTGGTSSLQFVGGDTVKGNLTLTGNGTNTCNVDTNYNGASYTIDGDVTVNSDAKLGVRSTNTGTFTMGSLTIEDGGEYNATSGTTTITKNTGTTGVTGRAFYVHTSGTFTHNNGLMKFTSADADTQVTGQSVSKNPFYDLEVTSGYQPKEANETTILNNATFHNNVTFQDSARYIKVLGICRFLSGEYNKSNNSTNANHYFGTLIIEGGVFELSPMEITVGSLRKLGGTIS